MLASRYGGKSKTQGENHPDGAIINYFLSVLDSTNEYRLEIKDSEGKLVRAFSNKAEKPANKWEPKTGANRFIWNMKTEGVDQIKGMILWSAITSGPYVIPGDYTLSMLAGDDEQTVPVSYTHLRAHET